MALKVGDLFAALHLDSANFEQGLSNASSGLTGFGKTATKAGGVMSAALTAPLVGVAGAGVKMGMDLDSSLSKIIGLVGVSRDQVADWRDDILRLAPAVAKSPAELADALYFVTSAGIRGSEALDVLETSAKASAAGLGETAVIADALTSAINAYGSETLSASSAADILTAAVREGKLESTELAGAISNVLPIASNMGVSFDEVGASLAAMSRTGTGASQGATQLRGILTALLKPTTQAEETLTSLGLSSAGLRKQIREEGLLATLENLTESFGDNEEAAAQVFGNVRALTGVLDMMGANAEDTKVIFGELAEAGGAFNHAFETAADTTGFKLQQAMTELQVLMIQIGDEIMPVVVRAISGLSGVISTLSERWNSMSPAMKTTIIIFAGILASLGPLLVLLGTLAWSIGAIIALGPAMLAAGKLIGAGFTAMLGPVGLVILAIVALVATAILIYKYRDQIKDALGSLVSWLSDTFGPIWNWIRDTTVEVWNSITEFLSNTWNGIRDTAVGIWNGIIGFFSDIWNAIADKFRTIWGSEIMEELRETLAVWWGLITSVWDTIFDFLTGIWNAIAGAASATWNAISNAVGSAARAVGSVISSVWNAISSATSSVWNAISGVISSVWNTITGAVGSGTGSVREMVVGVWNEIRSVTSSVWDAIKSIISTVWNGIKAVISEVAEAIKQFIIGWLRLLRGDFSGAMDSWLGIFSRGWELITSAFRSAIEGIVNLFNRLKDGAIEKATDLIVWMQGLPGRIIEALGHLRSMLLEAGKDIIRGLADGITSMASAPIDAITGVVGGAIDRVNRLLDRRSPSKVFMEIGEDTMKGFAIGIEDGFDQHVSPVLNNLAQEMHDLQGSLAQKAADIQRIWWEQSNKNAALHRDTLQRFADISASHAKKVAEDAEKMARDVEEQAQKALDALAKMHMGMAQWLSGAFGKASIDDLWGVFLDSGGDSSSANAFSDFMRQHQQDAVSAMNDTFARASSMVNTGGMASISPTIRPESTSTQSGINAPITQNITGVTPDEVTMQTKRAIRQVAMDW